MKIKELQELAETKQVKVGKYNVNASAYVPC